VKITGLEALTRKLADAQKAASELDGDLADLQFDAFDPASIEQAIQRLNANIDEKLASYRGNELVEEMAEQLKENGRIAILERASEARLEKED